MTQAISRETLALSLTSMQPPQVIASGLALNDSKTDEPIGTQLVLQPGKAGEMLVRLENLLDRPVRWKMEIVGDFPPDWCQWNQPFAEMTPHQKIELAIAFQVPDDFFENQSVLNQQKSRLQINYHTQIYIYIEEGREQLVKYRDFDLLVRPSHYYLNFLPGLYREVDFIGRLVKIFEQAFDPTIQTIDTLWAYLDPITAPVALLPFLAHWVGWELDSRWDIERQRHLIRHAITLYRWHGTQYGLRLYIHLYTGLPLENIQIREIFEQGFVLGTTCVGVDSMLGGGRPYHFIVELRPTQPDQINPVLVREIIEQQKPAFCTYELDVI